MKLNHVDAANDVVEYLRRGMNDSKSKQSRRDRFAIRLAAFLRAEKVSHDPEKRKAKVERKIERLKTKVKEVRRAAKKESHKGKKQRANDAAVKAAKSGPWSDLLKRVDGPVENFDA